MRAVVSERGTSPHTMRAPSARPSRSAVFWGEGGRVERGVGEQQCVVGEVMMMGRVGCQVDNHAIA